METKKIANLLNSSENEFSKFATKNWYVIDSHAVGKYSHHEPIKLLTSSLESGLCNYSDAYVLVAGDVVVKNTNDGNLAVAAKVAFKNCAPFIAVQNRNR